MKPSDYFILGAAFLSFLLSVTLWFLLEDHDVAIFVGIWVPSILSLGTYFKQSLKN